MVGEDAALVWVTRSQPGADGAAEKVRAVGYRPLVAPVLEAAPVDARLDVAPDEDLVVTSRTGAVRAAALSPRRDHRVYAVGDATAEAARAQGYREVVSASGDASALADLILETGGGRGLVHASGREVAQDLVGVLEAAGRRARRVIVYQTRPLDVMPAEVLGALRGEGLAAVLVHSPRGADITARLLAPLSKRPYAVVGLSDACLMPFRSLEGVRLVASKTPTEAGLVHALAWALGGAT
jgi:uroporphyrinogen-III synthase